MSRSRAIGLCVLALLLIGAWTRVLRSAQVLEMYAPAYDPAVEFSTKAHGDDFAGIDRWTYAGMDSDRLTSRLKARGYDCVLPQEKEIGGLPHGGIHAVHCTRHRGPPFARDLTIHAFVNYDPVIQGPHDDGVEHKPNPNLYRHVARLASVSAESVDENHFGITATVIGFLRRHGWLEPEQLTVAGLSFDDPEMLTRVAVDAITSGGWHAQCSEVTLDAQCRWINQTRAQRGFPALGAQAADTIDLQKVAARLTEIGLYTTRSAVNDKTVVVRVERNEIWVDFSGCDLRGTPLLAAVRVDPAGGAPLELRATVGEQTRTVALKGHARVTGYDAPMLLLPRFAGDAAPMLADWVPVADQQRSDWLDNFGKSLAAADPNFLAPAMQSFMAHLAERKNPDETLGMYPPLLLMDRLADTLRRARMPEVVQRAVPPIDFIGLYRDDADMRGAWALASCETTNAGVPRIDADCWTRFALQDEAAMRRLRAEINRIKPIYAELPADHPLRTRLNRLERALLNDSNASTTP